MDAMKSGCPPDPPPFRSTTHSPSPSVMKHDQESTVTITGEEVRYALWEEPGIPEKLCPMDDSNAARVMSELPSQQYQLRAKSLSTGAASAKGRMSQNVDHKRRAASDLQDNHRPHKRPTIPEFEGLNTNDSRLVPRTTRLDQHLIPMSFDCPLEDQTTYEKALLIKLSWPLETRCAEARMFQGVRGQFSIPYVIAKLTVKDSAGEEIQSNRFVSEQALLLLSREKEEFDATHPPPVFANRKLYAIITTTIGESLLKATTVEQLLRAVLHALLGHYILYCAGWLHRDVSLGNVLLLKASEDMTSDSLSSVLPEGTILGKCAGIIVDGDHAVEWKKRQGYAHSRSGTLPFISTRLTRAWAFQQDVLHTAIDDLNSFTWVLLITVLKICRSRRDPSIEENIVYEGLHSDDLSKILLVKLNIIHRISVDRETDHSQYSPALGLIYSLLKQWIELDQSLQDRLMKQHEEEHDGLYQEAYRAYIRIGLQELEKLKGTDHAW